MAIWKAIFVVCIAWHAATLAEGEVISVVGWEWLIYIHIGWYFYKMATKFSAGSDFVKYVQL